MPNDAILLSSDDSNGPTVTVESVPGPSGVNKTEEEKKNVDLYQLHKQSYGSSDESLENAAAKKSKSEKESKKQKQAEKAAKQQAKELNKIYKPGECMKYMRVEGHPSLLSQWWCADVSRELSAAGARLVSLTQLCDPALLVWSRSVPTTIDAATGLLAPTVESCKHALYVASAEDIAERVSSHTLTTHLAEIQTLSDCALTLVVFGSKEYFKAPRRKTSNSNRTPMNEIDLELAATDLLVSAQCDTITVNTPNELALLIVQLTKALAEAPFKLAKRSAQESTEVYMKGDNKNCVALDKNGVAVGKLWQQIVSVMPNSSLEISRALCGKYPTPRAMYDHFQQPQCVTEVANIGVSRATVPGAKYRRIGPEFARKLSILFTATDGNTVIE